jgi:biopolymer transport protein ExbB
MKLERRLAYLATLGNNAPFIGLFGTVIGIIGAFKALGEQSKAPIADAAAAAQSLAPAQVMSAISEALVATAVGIAIAIPAVAANNFFQRWTKRILANTEALTKVLLSHMNAVPVFAGAEGGGKAKQDKPQPEQPAKAQTKKKSDEDD